MASLLLVNYILIVLFLQEYYLGYFFILSIIIYTIYNIQYISSKLNFYLSLFMMNITPFVLEYFDNSIFYFYLFFDLEKYYIFISNELAYILSFLHSIIFFLGYNGKKYF